MNLVNRFICWLLGHDWQSYGCADHMCDPSVPHGLIADLWTCRCGAKARTFVFESELRERFRGKPGATPVKPRRKG